MNNKVGQLETYPKITTIITHSTNDKVKQSRTIPEQSPNHSRRKTEQKSIHNYIYTTPKLRFQHLLISHNMKYTSKTKVGQFETLTNIEK